MISNPANFRRRIDLAKEFIWRMQKESDIILYLVELSYNGKF